MNITHHRSSLTSRPPTRRGLIKSAATLLCGALASTLLLPARPAAATETVSVKALHNFDAEYNIAAQASGALIVGLDGNFYGTSAAGGSHGTGTVFQLTPDGSVTVIHNFTAAAGGINADGAAPSSTLVQGDNGYLYGTAQNGGAYGAGTVFRISITGAFTTLHSFDLPAQTGHNADGAHPYAGLVLSYNGSFYGTTALGGANGTGTIFQIAPNGTFVNLHDFSARDANGINADGASPYAGLIQSEDGYFYGATSAGGAHGTGSIFKFAPGGAVNPLHDFTAVNAQGGNSDGATPEATLIEASDGNFYGATIAGGTKGSGTVFRVKPDGSLTVFHSFTAPNSAGVNADGAYPFASLVQADNGIIYGATAGGGTYATGTLYKVLLDGSFTSLHSFDGPDAYGDNFEGAIPYGGLVQGADGCLYGVSSAGGLSAKGTTYKAGFDGTVTVLSTFDSGVNKDGTSVTGSLVQGTDGILYGTAAFGGANGCGTVFKVTAGASFTPMHSFSATDSDGHNADGAIPEGSLVQGSDGNCYGTAQGGGANGNGTVFRITPAGVLTTLHSFASGASGAGCNPSAGMVVGVDKNFYGTATYGGAYGSGTVFRITRAGVATSLYDFSFQDGNLSNADGATPAGLTLGSDGNFYGITASGGSHATGTIFRLTRTGVLTVLHTFSAVDKDQVNSDGANGVSAPIQAKDGHFYGTMPYGGSHGRGVVFVMSSDGKDFIVLHEFSAVDADHRNTDGADPVGGLIQGQDGYFYGATPSGGANGYGTIFRLTSFGTLTVLHDFSSDEGYGPDAALIQSDKGTFYGTTYQGGTGGTGTVFSMVLSPIITSPDKASATVGQPFSYQITATNSPLAYSVTGLPPGLTVNKTTGLISGTPTASGTQTLTLRAVNRAGAGTQTLTLNIASGAPVITSAGGASAQTGKPFSYQITATNNPTSYDVTNLRPGLSLNKTTGLITGKPTGGSGSYLLTLKAINKYGTGSLTLTLTIKD